MLERLLELEPQPYTDEDAEWDAFVAGHPHGSILQTTQWARLKSHFGWHSNRVWLKQDGRLVAGAQVLVRSAALGLLKVAYIPHGPLVDWSNQEQVSVALNQIDFSAYELRAGMLKMEPLLWQSEMPPAQWQAICERQGCIPNTDTIQPPRTIVVDLRPSEEEILAAMKSKTRYNIRLAEKKEVTVRRGRGEDVPIFNQLMRTTGQRNEFGVHEPLYYETAFNLFAPDNVGLFIAEFDGTPLAAIMVFIHGTQAAYLYGASSNLERQRMPTYAVQWAAMVWARSRGCTTYDLWGVPDESEETLEDQFQDINDGLWGVYRFKRGFGGQVVRTVGTADRVYNRLVYRLYQWRRGS
jgi:lipid II:glycine glycyltransferase (peptidoglycan interpeptide bridge formation enzyme)